MAFFEMFVVGTKSLMTHNPASMSDVKLPGRGSQIPAPEVEAEAGTYSNADGICCIRGEAFARAIHFASSAWKQPGKRASLKSILAHIEVIEDLVPLMLPDRTPITSYVVDRRRVVVQKSGIIRARPRFDAWACKFTIEYDELLLHNPEILIDIAGDAGRRFGVGDNRPRNGRFVVQSGHVIEQSLAQAAE